MHSVLEYKIYYTIFRHNWHSYNKKPNKSKLFIELNMPYHNTNLGTLFWKSLQSHNITILAFILTFSCLLHVLCTYHHRSYMQEHDTREPYRWQVLLSLSHGQNTNHRFISQDNTMQAGLWCTVQSLIIAYGLLICFCQSVHCLRVK